MPPCKKGKTPYFIKFLQLIYVLRSWQPSDSSPPLLRHALQGFFPLELRPVFSDKSPSKAFHHVKEGIGGALFKKRLNARKKVF